jgi:outer membrane immunogenic protein
MKFSVALLTLGLVPMAHVAHAQSAGERPLSGALAFAGPKVGVAGDYQITQVRRSVPGLASGVDKRQSGVGYLGYAGYDVALGSQFLAGVEVRVGGGGKTLRQDLSGGTFSSHSGLAVDIAGRAGVVLADNILLYGRAGYARQRVTDTTHFTSPAQPPIEDKRTDGGFVYGVGAELAVNQRIAVRAEFDQAYFSKRFICDHLVLGFVVRL